MIDPVADQQKRAENTYDFASELTPYLRMKAQQSVQRLQGISGKASDFASDVMSTVSDALPLKGKYKMTQGYGNVNPALYSGITKDSKHLGVDLATPEGTDLFAPVSGSVNYGTDKNFGNYAEMALPGGTVVRFSHLSKIGGNGDVKAGQAIGKTGKTGNSTGPHLDISAQNNGQYIDPMTLSWLSQLISG